MELNNLLSRKLIIQLKCEAKVEVPKVEEFLPIDANTYVSQLSFEKRYYTVAFSSIVIIFVRSIRFNI